MANDVPAFDLVFCADLIDLFGHAMQVFGSVELRRGLAEAGEIDGEAGKLSAQTLDDSFPKATAGGHAMNEEDGISRATTN
jgi:hypothetical protein